jgi:hypothetical protein
VEDMLKTVKDKTLMASLLYYFGVLTIGGETGLGKHILRIPNLAIRKLYVERIQEILILDFRDKEKLLKVAEVVFQKCFLSFRARGLKPLVQVYEFISLNTSLKHYPFIL